MAAPFGRSWEPVFREVLTSRHRAAGRRRTVPKYWVRAEITAAAGQETFDIEASSEEEALKLVKAGKGDYNERESEVEVEGHDWDTAEAELAHD